MSDKMDDYLSGIYGTGSGASNDLEKTAQAEMLSKLANEEGIDLSGLDEEQLEALAAQVQADAGQATPEGVEAGTEGAAATESEEAQAEEEAQAKFAEADFLGRVMAHSYTQELNKIAGENPFPSKDDDKKCKDCGKEPCECPKKEASGPLTRAIQKLGGVVEGAEETEDQRIEKRAEEMAVQWLKDKGLAQ